MKKITDLIPHRKPFLFVDVLDEVSEERIVGRKTFTNEEFFFAGHFPDYPVVPGVILIESMAQTGGAGIGELGIVGNVIFFLATVDKVKFRRQVRPNEEVRYEIENVRVSKTMLKQRGKGYVGDEMAIEAEWLCLIKQQDQV